MHTITDHNIIEEVEKTGKKISKVKETINNKIFGQDIIIEQLLIALLSGGHALLVGVPGLAKTKLVETIATCLGMDEKRIQFTPDLMPADITGSEVLEESPSGERSFRFIKGPVFCQLLMADEINRASPRTQSALLQAMQEKHITIAGKSYNLPEPFHVLATQNPIEQEGTYPLPEAQLDRFTMQVNITYPELDAERKMLFATADIEDIPVKQIISVKEFIEAQKLVRLIPIGDKIIETILELVRMIRPVDFSADNTTKYKQGYKAKYTKEELTDIISWGPGPRASQSLALAVRARCLIHGRLSPAIDDIIAIASPVLRHRMALTFTAKANGIQIDDLINGLCEKLN